MKSKKEAEKVVVPQSTTVLLLMAGHHESRMPPWKQSASLCTPTAGNRGRPGAQMGMWGADGCLRESAGSHSWSSDRAPLPSLCTFGAHPHKHTARQLGAEGVLAGGAEITRDTQKRLSNSGTSSAGPTVGIPSLRGPFPEPPDFLSSPSPHFFLPTK